MERIAAHEGVVTRVRHHRVEVQIEAVSACASCQAHGRCGFAESKNKTVEIPTADWQQYEPGQKVNVNIDERHGLLAVWIAYVLPALILLGLIIGLTLAGMPEWAVILISFAALGLYIAALFLFRRRVDNHFTLTISPHRNSDN